MSTTPTEVLETSPLEALDIDSIKAIMDGFDPASLLPELSEIFTTLPGVCRLCVMIAPVVLLAMGLAYLFFAPKEANWYFGYRCYYGMGSVYAWRFTQRFAGVVLTLTGAGLSIVMFVLSAGFGDMDVTDMVWKALELLLWEGGIALAANAIISLTAALRFDRKGRHRRTAKE
jgi:hypothetical protein